MIESESASFYTTIFNDLKNRGVKDILVVCHDNPSGFDNALETVFPRTENQPCNTTLIRNSTKYVAYKGINAVMADMKKVCGALNEDAALLRLKNCEKIGAKNIRKC